MSMSNAMNQLLLAALQRSTLPLGTDDLMDAATGLAISAGWSPSMLARMNRQSIAARVRGMVNDGIVVTRGSKVDKHRRPAPTYMATEGYDPHAPVPEPDFPEDTPAVDAGPVDPAELYGNLSKPQLYQLLAMSDEVFGAVARFTTEVQQICTRYRQTFDRMNEKGTQP